MLPQCFFDRFSLVLCSVVYLLVESGLQKFTQTQGDRFISCLIFNHIEDSGLYL